MKNLGKMSVGELAAYISTHLRRRGIDVVLTGGSCVTIYSEGKYVSRDLDFIQIRFATTKQIQAAMEDIGFTRETRHYTHPGTEFVVEFPSGPLSVGNEPVAHINQITFPTGLLRILSPTDCVKDRLAAYYHWKDLQSLEQAVLVARDHAVDVKEIARWSDAEGMAQAFARIRRRLE